MTRVDEQSTIPKAQRAGANTIVNPYTISGARMAQGILHPHAAQLVDQAIGRGHAEFEIEDVLIGDAINYNGALGNLNIPQRHNIQIIAIRKPTGTLITALTKDTEIHTGDIAVVAGPPDKLRIFAEKARGVTSPPKE